ncbi:TspO/MBR family protein [Methanobacterium sp. ACI-7]|uniref:TspO/MBR family protein n=1 Tax=unclassified Methanobacterium TaxID=2627676 RepID=UPI0039C331A8
MESFRKEEIPKLVISILIPLIVGFTSSFATLGSIPGFFDVLNKPSWTPPAWVFGPVWTTLYTLMGIALFLIWRKGLYRRDVKIAIIVFAVQLILNFFWTIIFFGFRSITGGLIEIIFLWVAILINIILFYRISKAAGLLLVPYIIWVTIASYLNYTLFLLNP